MKNLAIYRFALALLITGTGFAAQAGIYEDVVAAKNDALSLYRRLDALEKRLAFTPPAPAPTPGKVYTAQEKVQFVVVGIDCHADSAKKEVADAQARVIQSAFRQCRDENPGRGCGTPVLEFAAGQGTDAFTCYITATVKTR